MAASERRADEAGTGDVACTSCKELAAENESLKARLAEVEQTVEKLRRSGKRQSAPFSKGNPKDEPARPGRKKGDAHGRHGHSEAPSDADRTLDAPLPDRCPHCGDEVELDRVDEQFQGDLQVVDESGGKRPSSRLGFEAFRRSTTRKPIRGVVFR